jgi:dipeptidyl aminopeptidase/acylaminoacyl peptidase
LKTKLIFWLFLLLFFGQARCQNTYFEGHITHQNKTWKIGVEFVKIDGQNKALVDFIDLGAYNRQFSVLSNNDQITLERPQPNGKKLLLAGKIQDKVFIGKWTGIGIENADFKLHKSQKFKPLQEEISFSNKETQLSGTLILPNKKGKHPLIIFMRGGAAEDRHVYYAPALKCAKRGIAAFIYDKRGVGKSTGVDWQQDGLTALAQDAVAAVDIFKNRKDIDPNRITVFGHSEGGWTAPLAATLSKDIDFVIVNGASSVSASEQTIYHRRNVMLQEGFDSLTAEKGANLWKKAYAAAKLCQIDTNLARLEKIKLNEALVKVQNEAWFEASALPFPYPSGCPSAGVMELLFKEPLSIWQLVKVPVLAIWGNKDIVIPFEKSKTDIAQTLKIANKGNFEAVIVPNVNHSIVYKNANANVWDFQREAPGYFEKMVDWLAKK